MPLDMFQQEQSDQIARVQSNNAPHLPAGFGDVFQANWNENRLFGQSIAGANAKQSAFNDYLDDVKRKTGEKFDDMSYEAGPSQLIPYVNDKVAKLKEANPDLQIDPLTDEELDRRTIAKSRQARADLEEMNQREKTLGGSLGGLAGGAAGALTDPVNLVAAPLAAPEGLGLLATSLAWAGIAGGSQAAIEAVGSPYRDTVQPGYSQSGEPARNILGAAAFGGVAGGSFKALGMAWSRAKTGVWPRSVRDAGNVVESEANVAQTNVLPGIEGEVAHRDALAKSIDDVVAGRKIDVPDAVTAPPPAPAADAPGFDVYHGSPHDFDRFDSSKIGTGEGAQSYGHGLYFAENPAVAGEYAKNFEGGVVSVHLPSGVENLSSHPTEFMRMAGRFIADAHGDLDSAIAAAKSKIDGGGLNSFLADDTASAISQMEKWKDKSYPVKLTDNTSLYQVRIHADREAMLDWDKPLGEQPQAVRDFLKAHDITTDRHLMPIRTGEQAYNAIKDYLATHKKTAPDKNGFYRTDDGREAASKALADAGIPGIKYLDQGSRVDPKELRKLRLNAEMYRMEYEQELARGGDARYQRERREAADRDLAAESAKANDEKATRNIVLFDDKLARITHKNGEPLNLFDQHEARVDMAMDERAGARAAESRAAASGKGEAAPELPFAAAKEQGRAEVHQATIADGVQSIARMVGHDMPREEAEKVAQMVAKASTDEQARAILSTVADRPRTVSDFPPSPLPKAPEVPAPRGDLTPATVDKTLGSPDHEAAMRADIDRARATGDIKIPAGVDEKGEPIYRSLDGAMDEIDAYKAAAEQIQACARPQPEPAEAA